MWFRFQFNDKYNDQKSIKLKDCDSIIIYNFTRQLYRENNNWFFENIIYQILLFF